MDTDLGLAQRIFLDRKIAFAVTNRQLRVIEVGGAVEILQSGSAGTVGGLLIDLVPELLGSELALADILAGELPRLELAWINRETSDGRTLYFTMVDLPHRSIHTFCCWRYLRRFHCPQKRVVGWYSGSFVFSSCYDSCIPYWSRVPGRQHNS